MVLFNEVECWQMFSIGLQYLGLVVVCYLCGMGIGVVVGIDLLILLIGKGELCLQGNCIVLFVFGSIVFVVEQVGCELGLSVVNMCFIKLLDCELVLIMVVQYEGLVMIEDNVVVGGVGFGVGELFNVEGVLCLILYLGLFDSYQYYVSCEDLLVEVGIDVVGICVVVFKCWFQLVVGSLLLSVVG